MASSEHLGAGVLQAHVVSELDMEMEMEKDGRMTRLHVDELRTEFEKLLQATTQDHRVCTHPKSSDAPLHVCDQGLSVEHSIYVKSRRAKLLALCQGTNTWWGREVKLQRCVRCYMFLKPMLSTGYVTCTVSWQTNFVLIDSREKQNMRETFSPVCEESCSRTGKLFLCNRTGIAMDDEDGSLWCGACALPGR